MLVQLFIAMILIVLTVIIHALALDFSMRHMRVFERISLRLSRRFWKAYSVTIAVLIVICAHIVQIWLWALLFLAIGELSTLEEALYFSVSAFTTLGMGDIVFSEQWRILSSIEAANGFILFGWSTAFIFEIMSQLYRKEADKMLRYKKKD